MASDSHFLRLPYDLRDQIYRAYLMIGAEDGYVLDFPSGKLRTADDHQRIDLNLMYTCKLVAGEMKGLALRIHTITFSTVYSDDLRATVGRFGYLLLNIHDQLSDIWDGLGPCMDQGKIQEVGRCFPELLPALRVLVERGDDVPQELLDATGSHGETPSVFRDGMAYALQIVAADPGSAERLLQRADNWASPNEISDLVSFYSEPWLIPTKVDVERVAELSGATAPFQTQRHWEATFGKSRVSAAAAAIHFLRSIPSSRAHVRNILLREDYPAVGYPECHAKGLIPFCIENPQLRIQRRVDLWRAVLLHAEGADVWPWERRLMRAKSWQFEEMKENRLARPVATWMAEAASLGRFGMPQNPNPFTLVFDGEPIPDAASKFFHEVIQRDAAWQEAREQRFTSGSQDWMELRKLRRSPRFKVVGFPQLLRDLVANWSSSGIRCTFDPGESVDVARLVEDNQGLDWDDEGEDRWLVTYGFPPPLPSWWDLMRENILPDWVEPEDE